MLLWRNLLLTLKLLSMHYSGVITLEVLIQNIHKEE